MKSIRYLEEEKMYVKGMKTHSKKILMTKVTTKNTILYLKYIC